MDEAFCERRAAELRVLQGSNPRELIAKYCEITGESATSQLPHGVSFNRMIETIVNSEAVNSEAVKAEAVSEKSPVATN